MKNTDKTNYFRDLAISFLVTSPIYLYAIVLGKSDEYEMKILKVFFFLTITLFSIYKFMVPQASNPKISLAICMLLPGSVMWACIFGFISKFIFLFIRGANYGRDAYRYDKELSYWGISADYTFWFGFFPGFILTVILFSVFVIKDFLPPEEDGCRR